MRLGERSSRGPEAGAEPGTSTAMCIGFRRDTVHGWAFRCVRAGLCVL